jgi:hypothetical protein
MLRSGVVGVALMWGTIVLADEPATVRSTRIIEENKREGSTDWQLTRVRVDSTGYRSTWIEGYCSRQSVHAGETIDVMVSTKPARPFNLEVFRMGYYGGRGARLVQRYGPLPGKAQVDPTPGDNNVHECHWDVSQTITIPSDWISGVYLGRLTTVPSKPEEPYWQSYVIFIVRDDRAADILFQCSDNTWQAYNRWPSHYSVYTDPKGSQGPWATVSFDRPYAREAQHDGVVDDPLTVGSGEFLPFEFPLAYWLESHGYDVIYASNSDLARQPSHDIKLFISVGHDEYWDLRQYRHVEQMRDAGTSLLFLSGNAVCWVTPMTESSMAQPFRRMFRGGPYGAENAYALQREKEHGPFPHRGPDEGLLMGARNVEPVNGGGDWVVQKPEHWMFDGTSMRKGDLIPGLVGWEYHGEPAKIKGLDVVAAGTAWVGGDLPQSYAATIYPTAKGGFVFNAATIFWSQGLSSPPGHTLPWSHYTRPHGPDHRVQKITQNLVERAIHPHGQ